MRPHIDTMRQIMQNSPGPWLLTDNKVVSKTPHGEVAVAFVVREGFSPETYHANSAMLANGPSLQKENIALRAAAESAINYLRQPVTQRDSGSYEATCLEAALRTYMEAT